MSLIITFGFSFDKLGQAFDELERNFEVPQEEFGKIKRTYFSQVCSDKTAFLVSLPGFAGGIYVVTQVWNGNIVIFAKIPPFLIGNLAYVSYSIFVVCFAIYLVLARQLT